MSPAQIDHVLDAIVQAAANPEEAPARRKGLAPQREQLLALWATLPAEGRVVVALERSPGGARRWPTRAALATVLDAAGSDQPAADPIVVKVATLLRELGADLAKVRGPDGRVHAKKLSAAVEKLARAVSRSDAARDFLAGETR